jgi:hypothetical protein
VLQNIFLSEREKIRAGWRKLPSEEGHDLLFLTNVKWVNKSRKMTVA